MVTYEQDEEARHHFHWKAAIYAGLGTGLVFLAFSTGNPWGSVGFPTHVMGRVMFADQPGGGSLLTAIVHMIVSFCYALIIAGAISHLRTRVGIIAGGVVGLLLYGLNFLLFQFVLPDIAKESEPTVALTHFAFGLVSAGMYKAFSIPRAVEAPAR